MAKILDILEDGEWHNLKEIQQKTILDRNKIQKIIGFLREYSFIIVNEAKEKIRSDEDFQELLTQTTSS